MAATIDRTAYIEECRRSVYRLREEQTRAEFAQSEFQSRVNIFIAQMQIDHSLLMLKLWSGGVIETGADK